MKSLIEKLRNGSDLSSDDVALGLAQLLSDQVDDELKAEFLTVLHQKGESAEEIVAFAKQLMKRTIDPMIDPAEMMTRAFYLWRQTRWPGRHGRVRYAHTLFNLYVIRCLELLSMRLWGCRIEQRRRSALARSRRARPAQGNHDG